MATLRRRGPKWQVQIRRQGYQKFSKTFLFKEDAERWAREIERTIDCGENPASMSSGGRATVSEILTHYQTEVSSRKRSYLTEQFYIQVIKRHPIGILQIKHLKPDDLRRYREDRLRIVSSSTVRNEMALMLHAIKIAKSEWGYAVKDDVLKTPKPPAGKSRNRRLEDGELGRLIQALENCRNPLMMQVFKFSLATGMRRGEVLSLSWSNVDFAARTVFLPITKNGDCRTVPLSGAALQVLRQTQTMTGQASLVFPISANAVRLSWERVKKRAGILNLRFHDLRHEAISRFFESGLAMPEVALISGHKDPRMLFRYTHLRATNIAIKIENL